MMIAANVRSSVRGLRQHSLQPLRCQMRLDVERAAFSQNDVDASRPPGSSCCTLFCSRLAINVLHAQSTAGLVTSALTMSSLKKLLLQAVRDWDAKRLVDGAPAHETLALEHAAFSQECAISLDEEQCILSRSGVQDALCQDASFAVLLTAIPSTHGGRQQQCGKTFAILALADAIHLVDSHPHCPSGDQLKGMLRATVKSTKLRERARKLCDWMWADDGFLKELHCSTDFVEITRLRMTARTGAVSSQASGTRAASRAASNQVPTSAAIPSGGTHRGAASSPKGGMPHRRAASS